MHLESIIYVSIILLIIYHMSCSENFESIKPSRKECSDISIDNQIYDYNVSSIKHFVRP